MGKEIEAKIRLAETASLEARLSALGAEYLGAWIEEDHFYDHADNRLMESDSALRMRLHRPQDEAARRHDRPPLLTFKGPKESGRVKVREEHQVDVPDAERLAAILGALSFHEAFCYEKRRRKWRLDGAEVTIDEIPTLGFFVEVEAGSEEQVEQLCDRLGFAGVERISSSYASLLAEKRGGWGASGCIRLPS